MPESAASASKSRETRITACLWCGDTLPKYSRKDAKYCCDRCRHYARLDRGSSGRIYRTTELKSGMISVVLHMKATTLIPGDQVKVGK